MPVDPDLPPPPDHGATVLDPDLLEILVCPETKQPVSMADAALLASLNEAIGEGSVHNRGGDPVRELLDEGLVREDGAILYPVRDEIPVMLIDEGIPLEGGRDHRGTEGPTEGGGPEAEADAE